jgi:hypothetical protein
MLIELVLKFQQKNVLLLSREYLGFFHDVINAYLKKLQPMKIARKSYQEHLQDE